MSHNKENGIMVCPNCGKQAISFIRFTFIDPRKTRCSHCKVQLRANRKLRRMFWCSVAYLFAALAVVFALVVIFRLEATVFALLIVLAIPGLLYEYHQWKTGGYDALATGDE